MNIESINCHVGYNLINLNFEDFLDSITTDELIMLYQATARGDVADRESFLRWNCLPAYIYTFLLCDMILTETESNHAKKARMVLKLAEPKRGVIVDMYNTHYMYGETSEQMKEYPLHNRIEILVHRKTIHELVESLLTDDVSPTPLYISTLYLGFISQLNSDDYRVVEGVYKVLDLKKSLNRLLDSINFTTCLLDIYSILFMQSYLGLAGTEMAAIDYILKSPIQDLPPYSKTKQSFFKPDESELNDL